MLRAKKQLLAECGTECKFINYGNGKIHSCAAIAVSTRESLVTYSVKNGGIFGQMFGASNLEEMRDKATEGALAECQKKGGTDCKLNMKHAVCARD